MKKIFLIAAVAMLASCGGNENAGGNAGGEQKDSVATEQAAQAQGAVAAENDYFQVTAVPEGWEVNKDINMERQIEVKLKPGTDLGEWQNVTVEFMDVKEPQECVDMLLQGSEATRKAGDDVTIGDRTFKQVQWINSADISCALLGKTPKGVAQIILTEKLTVDNPAVKAIIEGIKFK